MADEPGRYEAPPMIRVRKDRTVAQIRATVEARIAAAESR